MTIQYLQIFFAGLFISLTGSLPLGNLNVTAMQIAVKESTNRAMWFSAGVVIVEFTYLVATLCIISQFAINEKVFILFQTISVLLLMFMAVGSFRASIYKDRKHIILDRNVKRWYLGAAMSAVNPMQVTFWSGWIIYLLSRSIITDTVASYSLFAVSAGIGTFIALITFIFMGRQFSEVILRKDKQVNILFGCLFAAMAIFQCLKLWQH